jgi:superoxide dismutase
MKENINKEIDKVTKDILLILIDLQKISKTLEEKALNHHHIKTQNDYIDSLNNQLDDIGDKDEKIKIKKLKRIKQINNAFIKSQNIKIEELKDMDANTLTKKMKDFVIPDEEE